MPLCHFGQRKLLLSEIQFLTAWAPGLHRRGRVVYAGAGPGTHITLLAALFPQLTFHLFDPRPVKTTSHDPTQLLVYARSFTDDDARFFGGQPGPTLFIADCRRRFPGHAATDVVAEAALEASIREDNAMQLRWSLLINAQSLLKLRPPYPLSAETPTSPANCSDVRIGTIFLQAWAGVTSSESRLCCGPPPNVSRAEVLGALDRYDADPTDEAARACLGIRRMQHGTYDRQLAYYNQCTRFVAYPHVETTLPTAMRATTQLDTRHDSALELCILTRYLQRFSGVAGCVFTHWDATTDAGAWLLADFSNRVRRGCTARRAAPGENPARDSTGAQ
jgi:hypothetical protein